MPEPAWSVADLPQLLYQATCLGLARPLCIFLHLLIDAGSE